jgi:hypothetical protein
MNDKIADREVLRRQNGSDRLTSCSRPYAKHHARARNARHGKIVRAYGAREIASGILCLPLEKHAGLRDDNPKKDNVTLALLTVAG